ncbi:MAG: SH3 domain-containing protein [Thermodesulfobacteriota bacterium]
MQEKMLTPFFTAILLVMALSIAHAGQSLWVTSDSADLKAERSVSSETIAVLERGAELTEQSYESRWYRVTTENGKTGWVYRGRVSGTQPEGVDEAQKDDGGGIGGLLGGLSGSSVEADSADSARSIRGLSPEARAYADKTGTPEQSRKALDRVLSMSVEGKEIERFLKNGQIGQYAE